MEITEIRIKLMDDSEDRLRAFCSITFDHCFVVRDLKIIEGNNGPFVAMPSRKLTAHCPECRSKNHLRARFCNQCGKRLPSDQVDFDSQGRAKLYADVAHPINAECREMIQDRVISEFERGLERAKMPGYVSRYDDTYDESQESPSSRQERGEPKQRTQEEGTNDEHESIGREDPAQDKLKGTHQPDSPKTDTTAPEERGDKSGKKGSNDSFGEGIFD